MKNKLTDKIILWYKTRLLVVKCLFGIAVCLALCFFLFDFTETPELQNEDEASIAQKLPIESSGFANDVVPESVSSAPEELPPHDLQNKISEIINSVEIEDYLYEDNAAEGKEDATDNQEQPQDNVIIKEEDYEPKKEQKTESDDNLFMIAIVIDDIGISQQRSKEIIDIDAEITTSFLTYGKNLKSLTDSAKQSGKEVIVHIPMEPYSDAATAPDQLDVAMSNEEIKNNLTIILDHFDKDLIGGNNHMGSKFTEDREKMSAVMKILHNRNMFFLDSVTTGKTIGCSVAREFKVPCATRDVFLDNENKFDYIMGQLKRTEKVAARKGYAIAIGHPKTEMIAALKEWTQNLDKEKYKLVHLSEIIEKIKNKKKNP